MFQEQFDDPDKNNYKIIPTIKAVGIFSKAIVTFMGEEELKKYMDSLIEVS